MNSPQTSQNIRSAYVWSMAGTAVKQALSFGLTMLLARFLEPADYGLVGMVSVFLTVFASVQDGGVAQAVVYFKDSEEKESTYFTISVLISAGFTLVFLALAPLIGTFYQRPELVSLVSWMSLSLMLNGIRAVSQAKLLKKFDFRRITMIETATSLLASTIAVVMAANHFGVWSLVVNLLMGSALQTIWHMWICRPTLTLKPDWSVAGRMFRWASPLVGSSLLWKLYDNADYMVIGRLMGSQSLGHYTMAFRLATLVNDKIGAIVSQVSFPTFASMQDSRPQAVQHWFTVSRAAASICFPALAILGVCSEDIVRLLLGPKWLASVDPLRMLCFVGALRTLTPVTINMIVGLGRTDISLQYSALNVVVMPLGFIVGCLRGGIHGVGVVWITVFPWLVLFLLYRATTLANTGLGAYFLNLRSPVLATIAGVAVGIPLQLVLPPGIARLLIAASFSAGIYCTVLMWLSPDYWRMIVGRLRRNR